MSEVPLQPNHENDMDYHRRVEVTNPASEIRNTITIVQATIALIGTIVTVSFFIFAINVKANRALENDTLHDKRFEKIESQEKDNYSKIEAKQNEILSAINQLRLDMKDKADKEVKR